VFEKTYRLRISVRPLFRFQSNSYLGVVMKNIGMSHWIVVGASLFAASTLAIACGEETVSNEGTGGDTGAGASTTGGNAGSSVGGSNGGSAGSNPTGGNGAGGGSGGSGAMGPICDGTPICQAVQPENGCATTVQDFEDTTAITEANAWGAEPGIDLPSGLAGGTYAYGDGGTVNVTLETADGGGEPASSQSFHYTQTAAVQWGGGFGFWFYCADLSEYEGVSFWLKGTLPEAATTAENPGIEIAFQNPETTPTTGCGNCETDCRGARVYEEITADWALNEYEWADIGQGNSD
jgi:hypothetical protein